MKNSKLIQLVKETIEKYSLCETEADKILIGVSGGVDSIVLCIALKNLGYKLAIAHCNFCLRSKESDEDAVFVKNFAAKHAIKYFEKTCDTITYAEQHKCSIEMAARDIRYKWFKELCVQHRFTKIGIAHNANDSVETFFINLMRSSGIKGLTGIPKQNGNIIRPLSNCTRIEIEAFAKMHNIAYRTDSTNAENIYVRNRIRNTILPELNSIQENSFGSIFKSIKHLESAYRIYSTSIKKDIEKLTNKTNNSLLIDIDKLKAHAESETVLFEILNPYGFNSDVIDNVFTNLELQAGKQFESVKYIATIDRDYIFVDKKEVFEPINIVIESFEKNLKVELQNNSLHFRVSDKININKNKKVACLDYSKLLFPLTIRNWQEGDSFSPFGLQGKKKVSDFLIDNKVPIQLKKQTLVLESNGEIVWLIGYRTSNKAAIDKQTTVMLEVSIEG